MKTLFPYFLAMILAGSAAADEPAAARPSDWAQPVKLDGLPNLHQVSKTLYRCAQPEDKSAKSINSLGIRTVVNLRAFHSDKDELKGVTAKQVHIKMKTWHAEHEDLVKFLKIATDPKQAPVLVHCQHGADRTGTACAVYRIVVQGWTKEEAIREMTEGGYGFHEVWKNLPDWIKDLDVEAMRKEAGITNAPPVKPAAAKP